MSGDGFGFPAECVCVCVCVCVRAHKATGIQWAEARDVAKHPTGSKTALGQRIIWPQTRDGSAGHRGCLCFIT